MLSTQTSEQSLVQSEDEKRLDVEDAALAGIRMLGIRVAVLDDDEVFLKVVERYAKHVGIVVETFANVQTMAEAISSRPYDVAVVDYYLDNDLGSDVAEALPSLPVILVSRKSDWIRNNPTLPLWIKDFVHKKYGAKVVLQKALTVALKTRQERA